MGSQPPHLPPIRHFDFPPSASDLSHILQSPEHALRSPEESTKNPAPPGKNAQQHEDQHRLPDQRWQRDQQLQLLQPGNHPPSHPSAVGAGDDSDDDMATPRKKRRRQALSCTECKRRKIKCDRIQPCTPCTKRGEPDKCLWIGTETTTEKYVTKQEYDVLDHRVKYLETVVQGISRDLYYPPHDAGRGAEQKPSVGSQLPHLPRSSSPFPHKSHPYPPVMGPPSHVPEPPSPWDPRGQPPPHHHPRPSIQLSNPLKRGHSSSPNEEEEKRRNKSTSNLSTKFTPFPQASLGIFNALQPNLGHSLPPPPHVTQPIPIPTKRVRAKDKEKEKAGEPSATPTSAPVQDSDVPQGIPAQAVASGSNSADPSTPQIHADHSDIKSSLTLPPIRFHDEGRERSKSVQPRPSSFTSPLADKDHRTLVHSTGSSGDFNATGERAIKNLHGIADGHDGVKDEETTESALMNGGGREIIDWGRGSRGP